MPSLEATNEQDTHFALRQERNDWRARAEEAERKLRATTAISPVTLELAHRALLEMRQGIEPWAALNDSVDAARMKARIDAACDELRIARGLQIKSP